MRDQTGQGERQNGLKNGLETRVSLVENGDQIFHHAPVAVVVGTGRYLYIVPGSRILVKNQVNFGAAERRASVMAWSRGGAHDPDT